MCLQHRSLPGLCFEKSGDLRSLEHQESPVNTATQTAVNHVDSRTVCPVTPRAPADPADPVTPGTLVAHVTPLTTVTPVLLVTPGTLADPSDDSGRRRFYFLTPSAGNLGNVAPGPTLTPCAKHCAKKEFNAPEVNRQVCSVLTFSTKALVVKLQDFRWVLLKSTSALGIKRETQRS